MKVGSRGLDEQAAECGVGVDDARLADAVDVGGGGGQRCECCLDRSNLLLAIGAGTYPEVAELIPPDAGVRTCEQCGGRGRTASATGSDSVVCSRCAGEGWLESDA